MTKKRKRKPQKRKGYVPRRLRKPPPFTENGRLRNIGLGITIGEGSPSCTNRRPTIEVKMCDEKAVRMLAKSWGLSVTKTGRLVCKPRPKNPKGQAYRTRADGSRAEMIMEGYEPEIIGTDVYYKWLKKKRECERR